MGLKSELDIVVLQVSHCATVTSSRSIQPINYSFRKQFIHKLATTFEGSLFNSYYTKALGALLLSLDCSTLPLIRSLYCWLLSKEVSSTIFKVFRMTRPGTESRYPGHLANTLPTRPMSPSSGVILCFEGIAFLVHLYFHFVAVFAHRYQVFLLNTYNLHTVIWFQVFLSNTNNLSTIIWL